MKNNEGVFTRGLSETALPAFKKYICEQKWLQILLQHKNTFFAIRNNYINIYGYGGSLVKLIYSKGNIKGETHFKYLLRKKIESGKSGKFYVSIEDGKPQLDTYTLDNMFEVSLKGNLLLAQAKLYAGEEKIGVHELMMENTNVLDTEIVFGKDMGEDEDVIGAVPMDAQKTIKNDRVDFCALHEGKNDELKIIFYEAKTISNGELSGEVLDQLDRYRKQLKDREVEILNAYRLVCQNIVDLFDGTDFSIPFLKYARMVVEKPKKLSIDPEPRLVIFGFDRIQQKTILPAIIDNLIDKDRLAKNHILNRGNPSGKWKELKFEL